MKLIEYTLSTPEQWLQTLHAHTPSEMVGKDLIFKPEFGKGKLETVEIQEGLHITYIDLQVKENVTLIRRPSEQNEGFIMNFFFSTPNFPATIEKKNVLLGYEDQSVLLASACAEAEYNILKDSHVKLVHLYFSRSWLLENVLEETDNLYKPTIENKPIYLFENIDFQFESISKLKGHRKKVHVLSELFKILTHFFDKIENREQLETSFLSAHDLTALMKVKYEIEFCIPEIIKNEDLAKKAGMSLSKFKKLFKQLFGKSPYQYHLEYKMEKAMNLLRNEKLSVSVVGYSMGYKNLSNFSKAFSKHHKLLPSDVKKMQVDH